MATQKQRQTARKNVQKTQSRARSKRTISNPRGVAEAALALLVSNLGGAY